MIRDFTDTMLALIRHHQAWTPAVVFVLAFGESLALVSLLLPATVVLLAVGGLIGVAELPFWPIWTAAAAGAVLGDALSYWLAYHFQEAIGRVWPLSRHPDLLPRGHAFFQRWGVGSVFLGRFFGPLRAIVPLVAGICRMPQIPFQLANVTSALVWATLMLAPGRLAARWLF